MLKILPALYNSISTAYRHLRYFKHKHDTDIDRIIVYSCIFGNYEEVKKPPIAYPGVQYLLFTDNPNLQAKGWHIHLIQAGDSNPRRLSRMPKILSHHYLPEHDVSVYMDGTLELRTRNIHRLVKNCLRGRNLALFRHYKRTCIYSEGLHCVAVGKEHPDIVKKQLARYKQEGFPADYGLFENAFIIRRNTRETQALNNLWWLEYSAGSQRDQLSFMYCLWHLGMVASTIRGKQFRKCSFLRHYPHNYIPYL
jgi:hypothetical protein